MKMAATGLFLSLEFGGGGGVVSRILGTKSLRREKQDKELTTS